MFVAEVVRSHLLRLVLDGLCLAAAKKGQNGVARLFGKLSKVVCCCVGGVKPEPFQTVEVAIFGGRQSASEETMVRTSMRS